MNAEAFSPEASIEQSVGIVTEHDGLVPIVAETETLLNNVPYRNSSPDLEKGDKLADRFEIEEVLGEGGQSKVFQAIDWDNQTRVAVKAPSVKDDLQKARFEREIALTAGLSPLSDGINNYVASGIDEKDGQEFGFMVIEKGKTDLAERLSVAHLGRLTTEEALKALTPVVEGVDTMHSWGVVNRDIKPANIVLNWEGKGRNIDLGIATYRGRTDEVADGLHIPENIFKAISLEGRIYGTPATMAPETFNPDCDVIPESDVFSLGATAHKVLTGVQAPGTISRNASTPTGFMQLSNDYLENYRTPRMDNMPNTVPSDLKKLVQSMLERDPAFRPTAKEVSQKLGRIATTIA